MCVGGVETKGHGRVGYKMIDNSILESLEQLAGLREDPDYPHLTGDLYFGLHCGVEDRDLYNRYDCADYGYLEAQERMDEWAKNHAMRILDALRKGN